MRVSFLLLFLFIGTKLFSQCPTPITFSVTTTPESCSGCCDGSAEVKDISGGCPPYNISWSNGSQGAIISSLCPGSYTATVYDNGCCGSTALVCNIGSYNPTNIEENNFKNRITLYPYPNNGKVLLEYFINPNDTGIIKIYDLTGMLMEEYQLNSNSNELILNSNLSNGIYLWQIFINDRIVKSDKLIVIK